MSGLVVRASSAGAAWLEVLESLVRRPEYHVSPRGEDCREITNVHLHIIDPYYNIFVSHPRNLQYRFMVAEWLWIWFGHEDVESIARYNKHIAKFSDDGSVFTGAYGPRIRRQWPNLVQLLLQDRESRQAAITIFDGIIQSKDVPCTLTIQFLVRKDQLHTVVNMRSSDVWLGLPYDIFNFTMLGHILGTTLGVELGSFQMNLGSSHLYIRNFEAALDVLKDQRTQDLRSPYPLSTPPQLLNDSLLGTHHVHLSEPWSSYQAVLHSKNNTEALEVLRELSAYTR